MKHILTKGNKMFSVVPKKLMLDKIEKALTTNLKEVIILFPSLHEKIINSLMWGIFSKDQAFKTNKKSKSEHKFFALMSYDIVDLAKEKLKSMEEIKPQFFVAKVDTSFQEKDFMIYLDYEGCDVLVEEVPRIAKVIKKDYQGIIAITLPDSEVVFSTLIEGNFYDSSNRWVLEHMDTYDAWRYEVMKDLHNYLWQIGGYGRWIQDSYNETYVAQANIEIGDAGSIFIEIDNEEFKADIDMY